VDARLPSTPVVDWRDSLFRGAVAAATFVRVQVSVFARSMPTCAVNPIGSSAIQACAIGERIGIDWRTSRSDVEQFRLGPGVELEPGRRDPATNVSDEDEVTTGKIAWVHLNEFPDYCTRLAKMETEAGELLG
jgi:Protein of unknown function (DUF5661)